MIRPYRETDRAELKRITAEVFALAAIDYHIEQQVGLISGHNWTWRKLRHIDDDIRENASGVFVYEGDTADGRPRCLGYISVRLDRQSGIGRISNVAVSAPAQSRGIGRKLIEHALAYIRAEGMAVAKIETLVGNAIGEHLYPAMGFKEVACQTHYIMEVSSRAAFRSGTRQFAPSMHLLPSRRSA
jgi:ribosomal protein S18 acetylase RimI-like enzyme